METNDKLPKYDKDVSIISVLFVFTISFILQNFSITSGFAAGIISIVVGQIFGIYGIVHYKKVSKDRMRRQIKFLSMNFVLMLALFCFFYFVSIWFLAIEETTLFTAIILIITYFGCGLIFAILMSFFDLDSNIDLYIDEDDKK